MQRYSFILYLQTTHCKTFYFYHFLYPHLFYPYVYAGVSFCYHLTMPCRLMAFLVVIRMFFVEKILIFAYYSVVKMTIHIFNPEHDIALAVGRARFTAPRAGRWLRRDLDFLPSLWAKRGDVVLVESPADAHRKLRALALDTDARLLDKRALSALMRAHSGQPVHVSPWGWDAAIRQELLDCGVPADSLPSADQIARVRTMSHRAWAAQHLMPALTRQMGTVGQARLATCLEEVSAMCRTHRDLMLKAPWSSSGRGVRRMRCHDGHDDFAVASPLLNWAKHVIERQGGVMVEPWYDKVVDFGMEFAHRDGVGVMFEGLSVFQTVNGAYMGNVVDTEEAKGDFLAQYVSSSLLARVRQTVCAVMEPLLDGTCCERFGVDMMVVRTESALRLHPCVELNLRTTMGHVALALAQLRRPLPAVMRVAYERSYHLELS